MNTYYPDSKIPIGIWDEKALLIYGAYSVELQFAAESSFGDPVYTLKLKDNALEFNRWLYARTMIFFNDRYLFIETVPRDSFGPIDTVLVDLKESKLASLNGWYNKIKSYDKTLVFVDYYGQELEIGELASLNWQEL